MKHNTIPRPADSKDYSYSSVFATFTLTSTYSYAFYRFIPSNLLNKKKYLFPMAPLSYTSLSRGMDSNRTTGTVDLNLISVFGAVSVPYYYAYTTKPLI